VFSFHLNHESRAFREAEGFAGNFLLQGAEKAALGWVGDRLSFFVEDAGLELKNLDSGDLVGAMAKAIFKGVPGGVRIGVRNKLLLAGFLGAVKNLVLSSAPGVVEFESLPERQGVTLVKVSAKERIAGENGPEALYYGVVGDGLYAGFERSCLERIIDRHAAAKAASGGPEAAGKKGEGEAGIATQSDKQPGGARPAPAVETAEGGSWLDGSHAPLGINLAGAPNWRALLVGLFEAAAVEQCEKSRERRALLERLGCRGAADGRALHGASPRCPAGSSLEGTENGRVYCPRHEAPPGHSPSAQPLAGRPGAPARNPFRALSEVRARLTFTDDGVRTVLEVREE
jgi:hypothetical protein